MLAFAGGVVHVRLLIPEAPFRLLISFFFFSIWSVSAGTLVSSSFFFIPSIFAVIVLIQGPERRLTRLRGRREFHAVVGENGAGKSTLMRILAGVHQPDAGRLLLDGRPVAFASAAEALASGVAMVYQDTRLAGALDAAWNVFLGHELGGRILVDRGAMIARSRALLMRLGAGFDPTVPVATLSRAERQLVEIGRALSHSARVLTLDEPTSALTSSETETLFALLRSLRAEGTAVVFISHRMPEVLEIADRISVLKDGELAETLPRAEATVERVVSMMVGRELRLIYPKASTPPSDIVLQVEALQVEGLPAPVSFSLRSGEILGFGGIQGSGQQETARALFGVGLRGGAMTLARRAYDPRGPSDAIAAKLIYVPADRRAEGLLLPLGVRENIALPNLHRWARAGVVSAPRERFEITREIAALAIRTPRLDQSVSVLSGGNQQKVVFARWSLEKPTVYVLDEPTQGIDVATKLDLYRLLARPCRRGIGDHPRVVRSPRADWHVRPHFGLLQRRNCRRGARR